jgi:hypothetical protein
MGGFNRRKMEDQRRQAAEKEAAGRRATDAQVLEAAERLIAAWNERQAKRMPMLFSPTIGAAITAGYWFLWVRCPACRTTNAIDLRMLDRHRDAAVTSPIPALSCRSCLHDRESNTVTVERGCKNKVPRHSKDEQLPIYDVRGTSAQHRAVPRTREPERRCRRAACQRQ